MILEGNHHSPKTGAAQTLTGHVWRLAKDYCRRLAVRLITSQAMESPVADAQGLEIDDTIVLLLGAPSSVPRTDGRIQGITRLEKMVFLLERETSAEHWMTEKGDFTAYNFGPFSSKVYRAVDMLAAAQIIEDSGSFAETADDTWERQNVIGSPVEQRDPYVTRDFTLTERGWRYYRVLTQALPEGALEELTAFKDRFARLPLRQLVRYVYQRYESFTERSLIRDEILGPG